MDNIRNKVIKSIQDEWETISYYNDLIDDLEADGDAEGVDVIDDINSEEYTHVGQLQSLLQTMGGDLDAIEEGEEEGDEQLEESLEDNKMENDFEKQINEFIEESRGYTDYDGIVQGVADEFDLSKDDAEQYVWNYMYTIGHSESSAYDKEDDEDLAESLIDPTQEDIEAFEEIIADNNFDIEKKGKTLFGNLHYQIIDRQEAEINSQEALRERIESFIEDIDKFEEDYNIPVTWNFGTNDEGILTAGIDLREKYVEDNIDESLSEARKPKYYDSMFGYNVRKDVDSGKLNYNNIAEWEKKYNGGISPNPSLGTKEIMDYYKKSKNLKESKTTFDSNEDWVNYLTKKLDLDSYEAEMLEHDLNNLRAYEWIDYMKSKKVPKDVVNKFVKFFGLNEELHNDYEVDPDVVNDYEVDDDANNDYPYIEESLKESFDPYSLQGYNYDDHEIEVGINYCKENNIDVNSLNDYDFENIVILANEYYPHEDGWVYNDNDILCALDYVADNGLMLSHLTPEEFEDIIMGCTKVNEGYKMTNKKLLNESKSWVIFFDENGRSRAGSDAAHSFNLIPSNIEKRIKSDSYHLPKWANSYIIVSDYKFNQLDWDELERYNKRYGKPINESYKMTNKEIKESLNKLDMWSIDNDATFYDLKTLYEAFVNPNSPVDQKKKEKIQKALNDPNLNKDKEKLQDYIAGVLARKEESLDETLDDDDEFNEFASAHPEYNKKFDKKRFGKFFDKNGKLIPEKKRDFWDEYDKDIIKEGFNPDSEEDINILYDIADRYCSSYPVSGSWEDETENELQDIMDTFGVSRIKAIQIMQDFLGFEDEQLQDVE